MQALNNFDNKSNISCDVNNDKISEVSYIPVIIQDAVNKLIDTEGFVAQDVDIKEVSTKGGNYMGDLYTIKIKGKSHGVNKNKYLFAKVASRDENSSGVLSMKSLYATETFAYTELNEMFAKIQTEAKIPLNERFKMIQYYETDNPNVILMNNMSKQHYKVFDRMQVVSLQFAELAIKTIAKFHALTFAIEKREPDFHDRKIKKQKVICNFNEDYNKFLKIVFNSAIDVLKCEESKIKLREFSKGIMRKCQSYAEEVNVRVRVLCHGDFRVNNMLYTEKNGDITDMILLDYQQLYYGHPIKDLFYFIFGATDQKFRKDHLFYLRDFYYNSFREFLKYFDLNSEDLYPRQEFEEDFKERLDYGIVVIIQTLPFILAPEDEAPDTKKQGISGISVAKGNQIYKDRVNDLVEESLKWGIL